MAPRDAQAAAHATPTAQPEVVERALPSGRTLVLRLGTAGEDIEIRSAGGDVDLRITLTDAGPVVSLRGARVEVDAADVAVRCHDFDVQASGNMRLASEHDIRFGADELRAETTRDIHLNGAFIRLNCTADGDAEAQALLAQLTMGNPEGVPGVTMGNPEGVPQTPPGVTMGNPEGVPQTPPGVTMGNPEGVPQTPPGVTMGNPEGVPQTPPGVTMGNPEGVPQTPPAGDACCGHGRGPSEPTSGAP